MAKNPFKKQSLTDTLVNVGIGGAANVAIDYIFNSIGLDAMLAPEAGKKATVQPDTIKNVIKIAGGAVVGGMVTNRYARAAADGVATVGVSNLISDLMSSEEETTQPKGSSGLPYGTIGRVYGSPVFRRAINRGKMSGLEDFQTE